MSLTIQTLGFAALAALGLGACNGQPGHQEMAKAPAVTAPAPAPMAMAAPVKYRVELTSLWTKDRFPFEYPDSSLLHKPHFSGLIGGAHGGSFHLFTEGQQPSVGLERLSEQGKHDPLDEEIKAHVTAGHVLAVTESGPLKEFSETVATEVTVDEAHSMVSLVAMIAPSPDWFLAVTDVNLMENGTWAASRTVDAFAWDSGGDDGTTFLADDVDTNPKKAISRSQSRHFLGNGQPMAVARITFTKM